MITIWLLFDKRYGQRVLVFFSVWGFYGSIYDEKKFCYFQSEEDKNANQSYCNDSDIVSKSEIIKNKIMVMYQLLERNIFEYGEY